jgi:hypothetical protein
MARIVSFSTFRGAAYASTSNYFSEEGRIRDLPASELPEDDPPISNRTRRRRVSRVALPGFVPSNRIGKPIKEQIDNEHAAFEGGADI